MLRDQADTIQNLLGGRVERGEAAASQLTITGPELARLLRPVATVRKVKRDANGDISEIADVPAEPA